MVCKLNKSQILLFKTKIYSNNKFRFVYLDLIKLKTYILHIISHLSYVKI